jgi:hypothetical protein
MTSSLSVRMKFDAGVMQELDVAGGTGGDELQEVTAVGTCQEV